MGAIDAPFLEQHCNGWPDLAGRLRSLTWDEIYTKSGVSRDEITAIADVYARGRNVVFAWTMGITHHTHGVENVQAIANLALMRGMVGRPHAGLLPIRGHSNVQGVGSVGFTPKLKEAIFERLQSHFGVRLPTVPGLDTMAAMEAAAEGRLQVAFCLGGNLFGSNPDAAFAREALSKLRLLVHVNTKLNTGHANALAEETIILPSLARDEEPQATTQESMFNYVRLSNGGPRRYEGPRSEIEVVAAIAEAVIDKSVPIDWQAMADTRRIREAIAAVVPGFEKIGRIDETKEEFHVGGRSFHAPDFATPDGRANLHVHDLPELRGDDRTLRLMTVRSEGQFNTVVYEDYDLYRGVESRDVILLHPQDIARLGLCGDQRVSVCSATGSMPGIRVVPFQEIRPGNALMYYPEANILVGRTVDPQSKTPSFKNVLIEVKVDAPGSMSG